MLHIFSELSTMATDKDIKEAILTNYSDIPSTTEAATRFAEHPNIGTRTPSHIQPQIRSDTQSSIRHIDQTTREQDHTNRIRKEIAHKHQR